MTVTYKMFAILLGLAAFAAPATQADEPVQVDDPAFDVYCPGSLIGGAWSNVDAALMTDCALLLHHGEKSLNRSRHGITAEQAQQLAVRMAVQKRDTSSLERLALAAKLDGNKELARRIEAALKLVAASRDTTYRMMIPIDEVDPSELALLRGVTRHVQRLEIVGDPEGLDALENDLSLLDGLSEQQQERLKQIMGRSRKAMPDKKVVDAKLQSVLRQLAALSRPPLDSTVGRSGLPWENEPALPPTPLAGGRDGFRN